MFQFNSNKLIKLCRKLIGMIEDNQIAEELTDKIFGIETKQETIFEQRTKYTRLVRSAIKRFNSTHPESEKVTLICYNQDYKTMLFRLGNKYNCISNQILYSPIQQAGLAEAQFCEIAHEIIMEKGMNQLFKQPNYNQNTYHGEESLNATHS